MKAKAVPKKVWVVPCPSCRKPVDFTGEGGIYFKTKKDAQENAELWLGTAGDKLTSICGCKTAKAGKARSS